MGVVKTLIYGMRTFPFSFEKGCVVNGLFDLEVPDVLSPDCVDVVTNTYQVSDMFKGHSYKTFPTIPDHMYDACFVFLSKQKDRALYDVADAVNHLEQGGHIVLCAAKNAGGERLQKISDALGLDIVQSLSKFHCKYVLAKKGKGIRLDVVDTFLKAGDFQTNKYGYRVRPGVFGWSKIDKGSSLLVNTLPDTLSGRGADFGCGYGYLTDQILSKCSGVTYMGCIDCDYDAVMSAEKNLIDRHSGRDVEYLWGDLTRSSLGGTYNFVVMNPPFHEGKNQDLSLPHKMIKTAHDVLGKYGALYMVSNVHLPYEGVLKDLFFEVETLCVKDGFKVFKALK